MEQLCCSIPEAGQMLGIGKATAYEWARLEDFPVVQIGNRKIVSISGLRAWVQKHSGEKEIFNYEYRNNT